MQLIMIKEKQMLRDEATKLFRWFLERTEDLNDLGNFVNRVITITKLEVRDRLINGRGFEDRKEMYRFAIRIVVGFYKKPYRMPIQYLN